MVPVIGFVGFIGSGKGAAGDILVEKGYKHESFANGVKDVVSTMFKWPRHLLEGNTQASREWREEPNEYWSEKFGRPFTPREALQKMGTEVGRDIFHEDFWVFQLEKRISYHDDAIVITDVRFPNEIEWIRSIGGKVYEIQRGNNPNWYKLLAATCPTKDRDYRWSMMNDYGVHPSEWSWIGCPIDGKIKNDGTIEDLTNLLNFVIID